MTPDELRALDCWVAEHVMGWENTTNLHPGTNREWFAPGDGQGEIYSGTTSRRVLEVTCPPFSTCPADAWAVVERMRALEWCGVIYLKNKAGRYGVEFWHMDASEDAEGEAWDESWPLAACLAAKAAIEGRTKE